MTQKKVFVVDDDTDIRSTILDALSMEGFEVGTAIHGQDALEQLSSMQPDQLPGCIFLDLKMPVMDGPSFLHTIQDKYTNSLAQIPIVVVSANGNLQNVDLRPAIRTMNKPLDLDEMYRCAYEYCKTLN